MTQKKPVNKNKTWNILRRVLLAMIGIVIGILIYFWNAHSLVGNRIPMPFGYGAAVVLSGSMEPTISEGDLIIVQETDQFKENDIAVFQDGNLLVVHRIINIDGETITTKGDANQIADKPIKVSDVKGKVLFWIPFIGNVVNILKTPIGTICIISAAIALVEVSHLSEKKKDDEEQGKIIEEIERLKKEIQR